ncbi:unnamed protein product [Schistosoma rodhaini]|uniref:Ras-GAP domain-containing protein n=1 Tax=Schistosoma rodhaini TaxID=6188 RepID=A0AA85FIM5_9TREM|nr:unnamed protein product [Schistosoma rodhaini]
MSCLKDFPTRLESWLDVWDVDSIENCYSEWKYFAYNLPSPVWVKKFCIILENEQRFYIFNSKHDSSSLLSPPHIGLSTINDTAYHALQNIAYKALSDDIDNYNSYHCFINSITDNDEDAKKCINKKYHTNNSLQRCLMNNSYEDLNNSILYNPLYINITNSNNDNNNNNELINSDNKTLLKIQKFLFRMKNHFSRQTEHTQTHTNPAMLSSNRRTFNGFITEDTINGNFMDSYTEVPKERTLSSSPSISTKCIHLLNGKNMSSDNISQNDMNYLRSIRKRQRNIKRQRSSKSFTHYSPQNLYKYNNYMSYHFYTFKRSLSYQQIKFNKNPNSTNSLLSSSSSVNLNENFEYSKNKSKQNSMFITGSQLQQVSHISSDNIYFPFSNDNKNPNNTSIQMEENKTYYNPNRDISLQNCSATRNSLFPSTSSLQYTDFKYNNGKCNLSSTLVYSLAQPGKINVNTIHQSLTGGRPFCFVFTGPLVQMPSIEKNVCIEDKTLFTHIFATESWESRARWIKSLRRTAKPNLENEYHLENSLRLSILEARNIPPKRRKTAASGIFWAEDFDLNNLPNVSVMTISLYREGGSNGRDSRRIGTSRISLKKNRKTQNQLIGYITIPVTEISSRTDIQTWLTLQPPIENSSSQDNLIISFDAIYTDSQQLDKLNSVKLNKLNSSSLNLLHNHSYNNGITDQTNFPQLRIRARYQSLGILPLCNYWPLRTLVLNNSLLLTNWLESLLLSVKLKEELANSLVYLHENNNTLIEFLTSLVVREVSDLENESMAFRSNTIATKAVECYVKFVGSSYLHHLFHLLIQRVLTCFTPWEVDPEKLSSTQCTGGSLSATDTAAYALSPGNMLKNHRSIITGTLIGNQIMLLRYFDVVWRAIQSSLNYFPSVLIRLFSSFREALETIRGSEFCDNLISGCIFLRLICPALLSPSLFGLISAFPSEPACQRNLTLLAKSLQSLANFSTFDDKEPYMRFLNGYVSYQLSLMRMFIRSISPSSLNSHNNDMIHNSVTGSVTVDNEMLLSSPTNNSHPTKISTLVKTQNNVKDTIDENCELANLHLILSDVMFSDSPISVTCNDDTLLSGTVNTATNSTTSTITNTVLFENNNNLMTVNPTCDTNLLSNSTTMLRKSSTTYLKTLNSDVIASLPNELCTLPKILDDISRALQCSSLTRCLNYDKSVYSVNSNDNNHNSNNDNSNNANNHLIYTSTSRCQQSNTLISSSNNNIDNVDITDVHGSEQSINSIYAHHTNSQLTTPYYTLHYNPGFHNPLLMDNHKNSHRLLIPQLKQSTSLTGLPSDISRPNPNDYDEPYISNDESDYGINDTVNTNCLDDEIVNENKMKDNNDYSLQHQSSLSATKIMELKKCNYSENQKKYEQKSISLDKLNDLNSEHIYDTVPFSSSSSRSSSSSSSLTKISSRSQLSNFNQSTYNNYDHTLHNDTLNFTKHQSDKMNLLSVTDQSMIKSTSYKSMSLTNNRLTSSEMVPVNQTENNSSTNSLQNNNNNNINSISPRLFPKQVTTANVILTKPSIMCSSSDSAKISKVQRQFLSNNSSRENMFDRDVNEDKFVFGTSTNTVQSNLPQNYHHHHYPSNLSNNYSKNNTYSYSKNTLSSASTEELHSQSDANSYNMMQIEEDNSSYSLANNANITTTAADTSAENNNNNDNNNKQPKELFSEVARLRYELLLSRQDALRAADRLSKQETEIYQLRQLLDKLINNNKTNTTINSNNNQSIHLKVPISNNYLDYCTNLQGNELKSYYDKQLYSRNQSIPTTTNTTGVNCLQSSTNNTNNNHDANVLQTVSATFKELDDAMARLELEQSELLREQARIRARIVSARPKQLTSSCKQSNSNSLLSRSSKSIIRPRQFDSSLSKMPNNLVNHGLSSPNDHTKYTNSPRTINSNNMYTINHDHNNLQHEIVGDIPKIAFSSTRTSSPYI